MPYYARKEATLPLPFSLEFVPSTPLPAGSPGSWEQPIDVTAAQLEQGYTSPNVTVRCSGAAERAARQAAHQLSDWLQGLAEQAARWATGRATAVCTDGLACQAPRCQPVARILAPPPLPSWQAFHATPVPKPAWTAAWLACGPQPLFDTIPPEQLQDPAVGVSARHFVWRIATGSSGLNAGLTASFCEAPGFWFMINKVTILTALLADTPDGSGGLTCLRCVQDAAALRGGRALSGRCAGSRLGARPRPTPRTSPSPHSWYRADMDGAGSSMAQLG